LWKGIGRVRQAISGPSCLSNYESLELRDWPEARFPLQVGGLHILFQPNGQPARARPRCAFAPAPEFQLLPAKTCLTRLATVRAPPSSCTVLHLAVACRARHPTPSCSFPFAQLPPLCYRCLLCYIRGLLSLSPSLFLFPLLPLFVWAPCVQHQPMPLLLVLLFCRQSFVCVPVGPPARVGQRDRVYEPDERSRKRIYKLNGEVRIGILAT